MKKKKSDEDYHAENVMAFQDVAQGAQAKYNEAGN